MSWKLKKKEQCNKLLLQRDLTCCKHHHVQPGSCVVSHQGTLWISCHLKNTAL